MGLNPVATRWRINAQVGQLARGHRRAQQQAGTVVADIPELAAVAPVSGMEVDLDRQIAGGHRETLTAPRPLDLWLLRNNVLRDRIEKFDHGKCFVAGKTWMN
jgi:hypothetical protein